MEEGAIQLASSRSQEMHCLQWNQTQKRQLRRLLTAHLAEIILYAGAYAVSVRGLGLGEFGGLAVRQPLDYLYFSIVIDTSLGLGDVFPGGHLRFLAGVEALYGLLLITWSGSFIYLAMGRLWPWERCVEPVPSVRS